MFPTRNGGPQLTDILFETNSLTYSNDDAEYVCIISVATGGGGTASPTVVRLDPEICVNPTINMPEEMGVRRLLAG